MHCKQANYSLEPNALYFQTMGTVMQKVTPIHNLHNTYTQPLAQPYSSISR